MQIPCPSGFEFTARKWLLGDRGKLLAVKDDQPTNLPKMMVSLAATGVANPGPYTFKGGVIDWDKVSMADIAVANILIRVHTDDTILLQPMCRHCRSLQRDPKEIALLGMPIKMASDEGIEHLRTGAPVKREIAGVQVYLKAVRGEDMLLIGTLQSQEEEAIEEIQMCATIHEVHVPGRQDPVSGFRELRELYRKQSWEFQRGISAAVDELFGGVDMAFTFRCDHIECRAEQEQQLPLDHSFYGIRPARK
ncbi:MAG TPA: hypothetical protein VM537_10080, partial [Anaerolineae bacterium]|nr:hypothetical protein [Anaerolineae bacterium]